MKRFEFQRGQLIKLETLVNYPLKEFSIEDSVRKGSNKEISMKYNLFGVSNHLMFTKSVGGHYTSYINIDTRKQDERETLSKTIPK